MAPGRANFYRILAGIYRKDQEKDSAIFYYNRAYLLAPADSKNIMALADYSISVTNYRKADSILKIALTNDSLNVSYLKLQIQSFYESKNYKGIVSPGEKLIGLEELSIPILTKLVFAYYSLHQFEDCIRVCELMDSNRLAGESTYYYESRSWSILNKPSLSNELLEKCLSYSISKTSELYYFSLAQNNESLKNYKAAVTDYDTAYYLFKSPMMLYRCGRIYDAYLKNPGKAKFYYFRFLKLSHPGNRDEKRLYNYIKSRCLVLK